jgi:hypothetical protein
MEYMDYWSEEWGDEIRAAHGHGKQFGDCPLCLDDDGEPSWCTAEPVHFELLAVNPGIQKKSTIIGFEKNYGIKWKELPHSSKLEVLIDEGFCATLWQQSGIDKDALMKLAEEQLSAAQVMGGFMLDRAQNAIGSSGWDFMKGDITAGLRSHKSGEE